MQLFSKKLMFILDRLFVANFSNISLCLSMSLRERVNLFWEFSNGLISYLICLGHLWLKKGNR